MSRTLTTNDAYALMNALVKQATGQTTHAVVDTSSFISAGEKVLATGTENVINSLSLILNKTIVASRPYKSRLDLMEEVNTGLYSSRLRKISFYAQNALPSGGFNTNLFTNLGMGLEAGEGSASPATATKSQWEQNQPIALEMNFGGSSTWQDCATIYEDQLQQAFRSPEDFNAFVAGYLTEKANDIESQREAWNRMNLLNKIASVYDMGIGATPSMVGSVVDLTSAYNTRFGTNYSGAQLRTTYLKSFLEFMVSEIKLYSKYMTERTAKFHWCVPKTVNGVEYKVLRHTPYEKQQIYLYSPLFTEAEAMVLPEIFNPQFLDIKKQYQEVTYWQSEANRPAINVTPACIDVNTGKQEAGATVALDYVVGMITDKDGLMTNFQAEISRSTPVEARKGYRNVWTTFLRNNINDNTENCVIFYMSANEPDPEV